MANGISLDALKARLLKTEGSVKDTLDDASTSGSEIPDDLIQVQSFVRWEKAGKPNYTAEEQLVIPLTRLIIVLYWHFCQLTGYKFEMLNKPC